MLGAAGLAISYDGARIKTKAIVAQLLLQQAWTQTLAGERDVKPWPWADVWPVLKIEIPRLRQSTIALSGVSGQAMAFGPGLMAQSATPGEPGLSIIAAHRDTHFAFLKDVAIGDAVFVTKPDGTVLRFEIFETRVVHAQQSGLFIEDDTPKLALVTCWPFDATMRGEERFVAIAELKSV